MRSLKTFFLLLFIIILGGCSVTNQYTDDQYKKAEEMTINFLSKNYQDANEPKIESVEDAEMGGIKVIGTVSDSEFTMLVDADNDGELSIGGISSEEGFPEKKLECVNKVCK